MNLSLIDGLHEELERSLPDLDRKLAAIKLIDHIGNLEDSSGALKYPFYHIASLRHLSRLILHPIPISSQIGFLTDLLSVSESSIRFINR